MSKKIIKSFFLLNDYTYLLFLNIYLYRNKLLFLVKTRNAKFKNKLLNRTSIINQIKHRKDIKDSNVCHIIGSGWSLNESLNIISDNDFVIGFNYAALVDIHFDAYFFEFGGHKVEKTSLNHLILAKKIIKKGTDIVFFKNIWESKNDIEFVNKYWIGLAQPIKDSSYSLIDENFTDLVVKNAFSDKSDFLPQLCSTIVTCCILAFQSGFDKIVIHGLDFGGEYFYEKNKFILDSNPSIVSLTEQGYYSENKTESIHPTALGVGMKDILPSINRFLQTHNVDLFCATKNSPSFEFIKLYDKNITL